MHQRRIIRELGVANPTVVVLTNCNDLDDLLFGTFAHCSDLLRQPRAQAASSANLRVKLAVASGGVVFTTIHRQRIHPRPRSVHGRQGAQ